MNIESPFLSLFTKIQAEHYFNIKTALIINGLTTIIINKAENNSTVINRPGDLPAFILKYVMKIALAYEIKVKCTNCTNYIELTQNQSYKNS